MMEIRERIAEIRDEKGISRTQLAERLKRTRREVWRIETGRIQLLAEDLPVYARALRVSLVELVAGRKNGRKR